MAHLTDLDLVAPADSLYSGGVVLNTWRARIDVLNDALGDITTAEADQIEAIGTSTISVAQWGYLGACGAGGGQLLAALTASESTQLEAIGTTTISAAQWGYLGACVAGGGQLLAALTAAESTQLEAIGTTTISAAQWGYLGACVAGGGQLLAALTAAESTQLEAIGTTTISATQWGYLGALNQGLTTTSTVTFGTINAFTLGGKLTAGAVEIEGSAFDINGGTVDGITSLTAAGHLDIGAYGFRANTLTADGLTSGRLVRAGTAGLLGDATVTESSGALGGITTLSMTGQLDMTGAGVFIDLNPAGTGSADIINITPTAALGTIDSEWRGIAIIGDSLTPSVSGGDIHGLFIDFSSITLGQDPHLDGMHLIMPEAGAGLEHHAIHIAEGNIEHSFNSGTGAGSFYEVYEVEIDAANQNANSTTVAFDVIVEGSLSGEVIALGTGVNVKPIKQRIETFSIPTQSGASSYAGRFVSPTYTAGIDGLAIFNADDDEIWLGQVTNTFDELQVIMGTPATKNISPEFYYYNTSQAWIEFFPTDGTEGFQQSGNIIWASSGFTNWGATEDPASGSGGTGYWIKIVRTRNADPGTPTPTTIKIASAVTNYSWDASGDITAHGLALGTGSITMSGSIGVTGTRVTKLWADDIESTNAIAADITGEAATVATIAGLAPDTATTQATQAAITTCANLTTIGTIAGFTSTGIDDNADANAITISVDEVVSLGAAKLTVGATTPTAAQWGYLGACGTGGGQLLAALTTAESTQLEALGTTTISANQWAWLGGYGINAKARAYLGAHQEDLTSGVVIRIDLDTETYDPGSNFNIGNLGSGAADGTTGGHLIDSGYDFAAAGIKVGMRVLNTTDTTYSYITAVAVGDLTLRNDVFVDTETWEVKAARFVVPVTGYYCVVGSVSFHSDVVVDKRHGIYIYKNGAEILAGFAHSSVIDYLVQSIVDIVYLTADDYIELHAKHMGGVDTTNVVGTSSNTFMSIHFLSKA